MYITAYGQIQVPKAGGGMGTPLIIPQKHANQQVIVQQIQHLVKQQSQNNTQQTVQQLITAASSNAATVLVTQAGQPVARLVYSVFSRYNQLSKNVNNRQTIFRDEYLDACPVVLSILNRYICHIDRFMY